MDDKYDVNVSDNTYPSDIDKQLAKLTETIIRIEQMLKIVKTNQVVMNNIKHGAKHLTAEKRKLLLDLIMECMMNVKEHLSKQD